jgi:TRAP-type C4-dicarboxylate transport system permease small subunit
VERLYAAWRAFQDRFLAYAAGLILLGCTLLALVEVVRRYVFGLSYEWQQDAVTYFILSGVFLYFSISQRRGAHLNVTAVLEAIAAAGPRGRRITEVIGVIAHVLSFLFLLAVVWWGVPEVEDSLKYETRTESLAFPMWPFLAALLAGFALMAVSLAFQVWRGIQRLRGIEMSEDPAESGGAH